MQYAGNAAILLAVLLTYTIDSKLHRQNIKVLRYCGGEELGRHLSRSFYKICYWFVAFAWIEQMFGLWDFPVELRIAGGVIFTICAFLRLLGNAKPGAALVAALHFRFWGKTSTLGAL